MLKKSKSVSSTAGRPPSAVEIAIEGVVAAALSSHGQPPSYAFAALPAGALTPGVAEANIKLHDAVAAAVSSALDQVSPRSRFVTLIVPDSAARVFVLDFDELPSKTTDAIPVLRFRLRKMVPFDIEHAALSYQVLKEEDGVVKVLATVMPGNVLAEYEAVVRGAGYEPGAVLPSSLAALAQVESMEPVLAANLSGQALTTSITSGQDLLLFRTVELPEDATARASEIQRSIVVAAAYYEDKLVGRPRQLHYAGPISADAFARLLDDAQLEVVEMASKPELGALTALGPISPAGISGALAGV